MPRFLIRSDSCTGSMCRIIGEEYHHIARVRRIHAGDRIECLDEKNRVYELEIREISDNEISAEIIGFSEEQSDGKKIKLCCALLKGKNFDLVIQKAVELGVDIIIPVLTERTIPLLKGKEENRHDRWQKKAMEATKQCMRKSFPEVYPVVTFGDLIASETSDLKIIAHPVADADFSSIFAETGNAESISLLIGPEGGFSDSELHRASEAGWRGASFGMNQLRAETAAIVLSALVIYESEKNKPEVMSGE